MFNWALVMLIVFAVTTAVLATEPEIFHRYPQFFQIIEPLFGIIFSIEYGARLWTASETAGDESDLRKRIQFVFSPIGILDLIVLLATLTPLLAADYAILRLGRLFRLVMLARLSRFTLAFQDLAKAVVARRFELFVTLALAGFLLLFGATALYVVEGDIQPDKFGSIPRALWWSIITLTTVGYGDVSPVTPLGKFLASLVALAGIGLVAMPTGIMAAAFSDAMERRRKGGEA
ncbi:ion transporter [Novosphingobium sp. B 225]|uniref:ion transporter n=1 Tax=Novosphingobium sp. B 225 TaxID=1961849 RepID=UPI001595CDDE|nr:ion transporter [Novosphingobium sp. B 225]